MYIISLSCISHLFPPTVSPFKKFSKIIDSRVIDYFRYKNMHCTTNSKMLSSHQLKGKIHFITVHIIRIKPFIDTVKTSSKKNLYYVSYFMSAYIVWKFNDIHFHWLLCFRILFYSIYIENTNKRIKFTFIYLWLLWSSTLNGTLIREDNFL